MPLMETVFGMFAPFTQKHPFIHWVTLDMVIAGLLMEQTNLSAKSKYRS